MDYPASPEIWQTTASVLQTALDGRPIHCAIVGGSGIGARLVGAPEFGFTPEFALAFADIGLPAPRVEGHGNALVFGRLGGAFVCVQTGRLHPYEGHPMAVCTAPLYAMLQNGAKHLVLTCAVGATSTEHTVGDIALLRDQIGLWGPTPLVGPRFVACGELYSRELRARVQAVAPRNLPELVYAHTRGPQYETPAETAALRSLGADVVGMSTTYEAVLAAAHNVPTCGLSIITNVAGLSGLSHQEVQERSALSFSQLAGLLHGFVASLDESNTRASK